MALYSERQGILARYTVDALTPVAGMRKGRNALLAECPATPRRRRLSSFEQAQRIGGQDASGWVLYRIANTAQAQLIAQVQDLVLAQGPIPTRLDRR